MVGVTVNPIIHNSDVGWVRGAPLGSFLGHATALLALEIAPVFKLRDQKRLINEHYEHTIQFIPILTLITVP